MRLNSEAPELIDEWRPPRDELPAGGSESEAVRDAIPLVQAAVPQRQRSVLALASFGIGLVALLGSGTLVLSVLVEERVLDALSLSEDSITRFQAVAFLMLAVIGLLGLILGVASLWETSRQRGIAAAAITMNAIPLSAFLVLLTLGR